MKKNFFAAILLAVFSFLAAEPGDYAAMLEKIDQLVRFTDTDLSAEYTIEKRDPGGSVTVTRAAMFRRDAKNQFLILILDPPIDKGKGYLKTGDTLWLYDPESRSFSFTSARERFQNSSLRNADFDRSDYSENYRVAGATKETLGKFACTVLDLEATNNREAFPRTKIWVSQDNLVRKIEDYSLSGQLMRTTAIPAWQKIENRWLPLQMVILDHLVALKTGATVIYERTTVSIKNPSLKKLPDSVYTKEYLERVSR